MNEASRRQILSSPSSSADAQISSSGANSLSDGLADAYAGVRMLDLPVTAVGDDDDRAESTSPKESTRIDVRTLALGLGIFALAALPRLFVLFFVTDLDNPGVGWYNDSFHHWQIGYLSKEIGFSQGFLRLWDFKGLEYFWGLLHPLALAILFTATGSIEILVPRLLSLVSASVVVVFLFFLLRRYFNIHVALAGALLAAINPVAVFADTAGLQGPLATMFMMMGLVLWPRKPAWAGVAIGIAGMARAEYWVFGAGLVLLSWFAKEKEERKFAITFGWLIPTIAYMIYMHSHTGNVIYPVYWNFMANVAGTWTGGTPFTVDAPFNTAELIVRWTSRFTLLAVLAVTVWVLRKKPKSYLLILYGVGNIAFLCLYWGFGESVRGWGERGIYDRIFIVPYMYIGILVAVVLLHRRSGYRPSLPRLALGWTGILLIGLLAQAAWGPILRFYEGPKTLWETEKQLASDVASAHRAGAIAIPEDRMSLTYLLATKHGISAQNLQSQMYDPFFYFEEGDPFANWSDNRETVAEWFSRHDIQLLVFYGWKLNYQEMIQREPGWFRQIDTALGGQIEIYEVVGS